MKITANLIVAALGFYGVSTWLNTLTPALTQWLVLPTLIGYTAILWLAAKEN